MRIFNNEENYFKKVNFIDINNVFVDFDTNQGCCENTGYFISHTEDNRPKEDEGIKNGLDDYIFDPYYFVDVIPAQEGSGDYKWSCLDAGSMVRFRMISKDMPDLFLHLYNSHNGYYNHGFEFKINNVIQKEGEL